jgi:hypothetical protein
VPGLLHAQVAAGFVARDVYARYSTDRQSEARSRTGTGSRAGRAKKGLQVVARYEDQGISGRRRRP